jgi:hypothetical protein
MKDQQAYWAPQTPQIQNHPAHVDANAKQIGGKHYKQFKFQPWDVVLDWELGYLDGTALKYIARWKDKNGLEDIKKAIHFLEKLVEVTEAKEKEGKDAGLL